MLPTQPAYLFFDGITLFIILFGVIRGTVKGLVDTVFDMGKFISAIVVSSVFTEPLSAIISGTAFFSGIKERVANDIENAFLNLEHNINPTEAIEKLLADNPKLDKVFSILNIRTETLGANLSNSIEGEAVGASEAIKMSIAEPALNAVLNVAVFILLFFLTIAVLWVVRKILGAVTEIPGIKTVNRIGGFILGFVEAVMCASLFCLLCERFAAGSVILGSSIPADIAEKTQIYGYFVRYNLFTIIGNILGV